VLLLLVNNTRNAKGIVTGKLLEYLASGVPVLAIGPVDGEVAEILSETSAGLVSGFDDVEGLKRHLLALFNEQSPVSNKEAIARYSRHELTKELCRLLDDV
jgi:glycosyltransferase involved in cell wall biosynthesis